MSSDQSDLGKKLEEANVDPMIQEAKSKNTTSTSTVEEEHPEIARAEQKEEQKVEKLEQEAQPTG